MGTLEQQHKAHYYLQKAIETAIRDMSDQDIHFAYWLNYENQEGFVEQRIVQEYRRRGLDEQQSVPKESQ